MKKFFLKIGAFLALKCRIYYVWSKVYRWLWERKYRGQEIPRYDTCARIEEVTGKMKWRKDTWLMLWDAISLPEATYYRHLHDGGSDCDDIALFAINRLYEFARGNDTFLFYKENACYLTNLRSFGLLSVPWIRDGKAGGHNVGVFKYSDKDEGWLWAHVSNWYRGQIRYGFKSLPAVVDDVLSGEYESFDIKAESVGWAHADLCLRLMEYRWSHKL